MRQADRRDERARSRQNLKDEVARFLRDAILSGDLRPGTKVDQDATAMTLGVSKLPVREALIILASEGMVDNLPRRGAYVAELTPNDLRDHYAVYGLVSGLAAERAAMNVTDDQLEDLDAILKEMASTKDPSSLGALNEEFHRTINVIGTSKRLRAVIKLLADALPTRFFEVTEDWPIPAHHDHETIVEALRRRDAEGAAHLMNEHLRSSGEYAVKMLRQAGYWEDSADGGETTVTATPVSSSAST